MNIHGHIIGGNNNVMGKKHFVFVSHNLISEVKHFLWLFSINGMDSFFSDYLKNFY